MRRPPAPRARSLPSALRTALVVVVWGGLVVAQRPESAPADGRDVVRADAPVDLRGVLRLGAAAPSPDGMSLRIMAAAGGVGPHECVVFGVPFARENAPRSLDEFVAIDAAGRVVELQWRPLVRYGGARDDATAPLRFAELTLPVPPSPRARAEYVLRRRASAVDRPESSPAAAPETPNSPAAAPAAAPAPPAALRVEETPDDVVVVAAPGIVFVVPREGAALLRSVRVGGREQLASPAAPRASDPAGRPIEVVAVETAVEARGPYRATVVKRYRLGDLRATVRVFFVAGAAEAVVDFRLENPAAYGGFESGLPDGGRSFGELALRLAVAGDEPIAAFAHPAADPSPRASGPRRAGSRRPPPPAPVAAEMLLSTEAPPPRKNGGQAPYAVLRAGGPQSAAEIVPDEAAGALGLARIRPSPASANATDAPHAEPTGADENPRGDSVGENGVGVAVYAAFERAAENAPKELSADAAGLDVRFFPLRRGEPYRLAGGRWKTQRVTIGFGGGVEAARERLAAAAARLRAPLRGGVDPAVLRATGAAPALFAERRAWTDGAAARFERFFDLLVDDDAADEFPRGERVGLKRFLARGGAFGGATAFGWEHFGDLPWAEGYSNLHYDWPLHATLGFARTLDPRFLDTASILVGWRRDMGQNHSTDARETWRGANYYEKGARHGDHRPGAVSHSWTHGLWLWYALTGDEGAYEAGLEAAAFALRHPPGEWTGWWGSRVPGWTIHLLVDAAAYLGDPRALGEARRGIERFAEFERKTGGHGCVINPADRRTSPWMECIFFTAAARYAAESGDPSPLPLLRKQRDWLVLRTLVESPGRVPHTFSHWAPEGPTEPTVHLLWPLIEALTWSALLGVEESDGPRAARLFDAAVCRWQAHAGDPATGPACSPVTLRPAMFPGTESKTLGNLLLWGAPHLAWRAR